MLMLLVLKVHWSCRVVTGTGAATWHITHSVRTHKLWAFELNGIRREGFDFTVKSVMISPGWSIPWFYTVRSWNMARKKKLWNSFSVKEQWGETWLHPERRSLWPQTYIQNGLTNTNNNPGYALANTQGSSILQTTLSGQLELWALKPLSRHNGKSTGQRKCQGKTGFDNMPDCPLIHLINNEGGEEKKAKAGPTSLTRFSAKLNYLVKRNLG